MDEEKKSVEPEFIYIDDRGEDFSGGDHEYIRTFKKLERAKYPPKIRMIAFLIAVVFAWALLFGVLFYLFALAFSLVTLFQVEEINRYRRLVEKALKRCSVFFLSALIAIFNPTLGIGLILLYSMMSGANPYIHIMNRFF